MALNGFIACLIADICLFQVTHCATVSVSVSPVSSEYGTTAQLSCHFSVSPPTGYVLSTLVWLKGSGSSEVAIAVYLGASSNPTYTSGYGPPQYTVTRTDSVSNLTISSVRHDDAGTYSCEVEFQDSSLNDVRGTASVVLTVFVPPRTLTITYDSTLYSDGVSIPVIAGNIRQFACTASGIVPAATFLWSLSGSGTSLSVGTPTQTDTTTTAPLMDSTSTVTVNIPETPGTLNLECQAYNTQDGTDVASIAVTIQVRVPPKAVRLSDANGDKANGVRVAVDQGTPHDFTCMVQGTRPAATIQWFVDNVLQSSGVGTPIETSNNGLFGTTRTLAFIASRTDHRKELNCEANTAESQRPYPASYVSLDVNGPPDTPTISGVASPMTEGVSVTLTCEADLGYPDDWRLDWTRGNPPVNITGTTTTPSASGTRYKFTSLLDFIPNREDNGNRVTCTANKDSGVTGPTVSTDTLNVRFCARNVMVSSCPVSVTIGEAPSLVCTSTSSNPATVLTWSEGDTDLSDPSSSQETSGAYGGTVTTLRYATGVLTKTDNKRTLKCCRTNTALCSDNLCDECTLNVLYPSVFSAFTQAPPGPVLEGTDEVNLTCTVDANPRPDDVIWEKQEAGALPGAVYSGSSSMLTLNDITREMSGYYTCRANNGVPSSDASNDVVSELLALVVEYQANIANKDRNPIGIEKGGNAVLICRAEGNPAPTLKWFNQSKVEIVNNQDNGRFSVMITESESSQFRYVVTSNLTIRNIDPDTDHGDYICICSNGVGEQDNLTVTVTGPTQPNSPHSVQIIDRTESSLTVAWVAGHDGGKMQRFLVSFIKTPSLTEQRIEGTFAEGSTATVTGLEAYTEYEIRVYAENDIGLNTNYGSVTGRTSPKTPNAEDFSFEYDRDANTVKVTWPSSTPSYQGSCIQLEVQYRGSTDWQKCGDCIITSPRTVTLSGWCSKQQRRKRQSGGEIEDVRAKLCYDDGNDCGEAVTAKPVQSTTSSSTNTGLIIGIVVGCLLLSATFVVIVIVWKKKRRKTSSDILSTKTKKPHGHTRQLSDNQSRHQNKLEMDIIPPTNQGVYVNLQTGHRPFPRDQLTIVKELGHGAFGVVFLAEARGIVEKFKTTEVAVKSVKERAGANDKADLMKELDLMKKLPDHNNVVKLLGFCVEQDPPYVILEYLSRGNLKDLLTDSRSKGGRVYGNLHGVSKSLASSDLMKFALDVADGMQFISSQQCIHRDLAARNVLVAEDMTCKVSDFGLARDVMNTRVYERTSEGNLPLRWMALESILYDVYTMESDVWSYGVLLWEIVTLGARPYPAMSSKTMIGELQSGYRMPKPQHCQQEIYDVMLECWKEDPDRRPKFETISRKLQKLLNRGTEYISVKKYEESIYEVTLPQDNNEKV